MCTDIPLLYGTYIFSTLLFAVIVQIEFISAKLYLRSEINHATKNLNILNFLEHNIRRCGLLTLIITLTRLHTASHGHYV